MFLYSTSRILTYRIRFMPKVGTIAPFATSKPLPVFGLVVVTKYVYVLRIRWHIIFWRRVLLIRIDEIFNEAFVGKIKEICFERQTYPRLMLSGTVCKAVVAAHNGGGGVRVQLSPKLCLKQSSITIMLVKNIFKTKMF